MVRTVAQVAKALEEDRGFYRSILDGPKIFLFGSADVLRSLLKREAA